MVFVNVLITALSTTWESLGRGEALHVGRAQDVVKVSPHVRDVGAHAHFVLPLKLSPHFTKLWRGRSVNKPPYSYRLKGTSWILLNYEVMHDSHQ